MNEEDIYPSMC